MANELILGVKIGAALAGTFAAAFASAQSTVGRLGQTADVLRARHDRMGRALAAAMAHPMRNVGALRAQYERLGATIERVAARQVALAASLARGAALQQQRTSLRGQAMETVGTAVALGAPVLQSVRLAAGHQDRMRDVAITGDFSAKEEAQVGAAVRESALKWNQTQAEVAAGVSVLVAGGIQSARELAAYAPVMAKTATATRASMDDLGSVAVALNDSLGISAQGFDGAMNMLAYAGKRGQFEIRDMAKWVPSIAPSFQALGVTGKEAVAEIGAALQIARKGAGNNDEAANNFRNFLAKLASPDTLKDFAKAGIDLKQSMLDLRAQGMTPMQAMLGTITAYMGSKGPAAAGELQKALETKDDKERAAALQRLSEAYALGELFQDMQAMNFIRPALANAKEMQSIKAGSMDAADKGVIDNDYEKRVQTANERFKAFKIGLMDVGITVGEALLPPLVELLQATLPVISAFGAWAKENPGVVKGVIGLVGGLLLGRGAMLALRYVFVSGLSVFNAFGTAFHTIGAKWLQLQALWQMGRFAPVIARLKSIGSALATGLRIALPWIGRAASMLLRLSPIGLALSAVGLVIYKYWQPIKGFFAGLWQGISSVAGPAVRELMASVGGLGKAWTALTANIPVIGPALRFVGQLFGGMSKAIAAGLRSVWAGVKALFAPIDDVGGKAQSLGLRFGQGIGGALKSILGLPAKFAQMGVNIVQGLIGSIRAGVGAAVAAVADLGQAILGKFKSTLGINSPSRVFAGYGDNIAQGAAMGIQRTSPLAARAVTDMAKGAAAAGNRAGALSLKVGPTQGAGGGQGANGVVIHYSPQITLSGAAAGAKDAVSEALQLTLPDLERLIGRVLAQQQRKAN